jgi:hypothetical protein
VKTTNNELSEAQELELLQQGARLKKTLKQLSKNQLISLVFQQMSEAINQQNINKVLLQELEELKKVTNE